MVGDGGPPGLMRLGCLRTDSSLARRDRCAPLLRSRAPHTRMQARAPMKRLCKLGTLCWAATHKRAPGGSLPECVCSPAPRSAARGAAASNRALAAGPIWKTAPSLPRRTSYAPLLLDEICRQRCAPRPGGTCSARARRVSARTLQANEWRSQLLI